MADGRAETGAMLRLTLIGEPTVTVGDAPVRIVNRKLLCMLAYLAMIDGCRESRERLVGLLWSESDEKLARGSLRQVMTAFRRISSERRFDGFDTDRGHVALTPSRLLVDVTEIERRTSAGDLHPDLLRFDDLPARLLLGCEDIDPAFGAWLPVQRAALRDRLLRSLGAEMERLAPDAPGAEDVALAILRIDPTHEEAARRAMEARALASDTAGAIKVYNRLYEVLGEDYDMEPSTRTLELIAEIKSGDFDQRLTAAPSRSARAPAAPVAAPDAPRGEPPVLLIEPFRLGGEAAQGDARMVIDGFRLALIASLVRFREWRVADGDRVGADGAPPADGPRFRVRADAHARSGALMLVLTILDDASGFFLWSDNVSLTFDTWMEAQSRLIRQVTIALNISVSADRLRRIAQAPDLAPSLYDLWLRGQRMILDFNPDAWEEAGSLFRQVIDGAPGFAPAYSSLAQLGNTAHVARPGWMRSAAYHRETLEIAQQAVALDPLDSRAQLALGWSLAYCGRWEQAELNFESALQLNSHDPWTMTSVAQAWAFAGRFEEAMRLARAAQESTPLPNQTRWGYQAGIRFLCQDYAGALEAARTAGDSHANNGMWRAAALAHMGETEAAAEEARACLATVTSRWRGPREANRRDVTRWLLHMFPIRREPDWQRLRDGLAAGGMPVDGASFGDVLD